MSRSFEEKSVWIQLVCMVATLGVYFVLAGRLLASGVREMPAFAALFMASVVLMVVLMGVAYGVTAIVSRGVEARDERDVLFAMRSEYGSSWLIAAGVFGAIVCMAMGVENVWTANLLLLSLALSEILGFVLQLVYYRSGV